MEEMFKDKQCYKIIVLIHTSVTVDHTPINFLDNLTLRRIAFPSLSTEEL